MKRIEIVGNIPAIEIVGNIPANVHPSQVASQSASTGGYNPYTNQSSTSGVQTATALIDSLTQGFATIWASTKTPVTNVYGSTTSESSLPSWALPIGIGAIGLIAMMVLKK